MIYLSTMGILRGHFYKSQILQAWKLFSMMCLLVMMCIAIFPTSSYRWSSSAMVSGTPCLDWQPCDFRWWNDTVGSLWDWAKVENPRKELAPQGVLSYMVLISAHLWQAVLLYKPAHDQFRIFFHRPLRLAKKLLATKYCLSQDHRKRYHAFIYRLIFGVYLFTFAIFELFGSYAFSLFLVLLGFVWATFQLLYPRYNSLSACVREELGTWSFGQILPLLLLLAPIYSIASHYIKILPVSNRLSGLNGIAVSSQHQSAQIPASPDPQSPERTAIQPNLRDPLSAISTLIKKFLADPNDSEARNLFHSTLYSTPAFRIILFLLIFVSFGAVAGYLTETIIAFRTVRPWYWWT